MEGNSGLLAGLSVEAVNHRYLEGKYNLRQKSNLKSVWKIISDNLFSYFNMILALLAVLLISIGSYENLFFVIIAVLNTTIGIIQELKARSTIIKLSLLSEPHAVVMRQGFQIEIEIDRIVLDDIYVLASGREIVTDGTVLDGVLTVNEANITGEAEPVLKKPGSKVFSGSFVVSGNAYIRVDAIGKDNYIETLSSRVKTLSKPKSVILESLRKLLKLIGIIIIPLGLLTFYNVFLNSGLDYLSDFMHIPAYYQDALKKMAGAMVAMVPSGLFLLTTITFASSVIKLARRNTLVQDLYSIESLARIDTICLDKTGTLTDGSMKVTLVEQVEAIEADRVDYPDAEIRNIIGSMNYALNENNPTGRALTDYFGRKRKYRAKAILPFSSQNKYSAMNFDFGSFVIGAPELVFKGKYMTIKKQVEKHARSGKRVLLFAKADGFNEEKLTGKVEPLALVMLDDHIRENVQLTLDQFSQDGVEIKIISGDNHLTVADVAFRAGVPDAKKAISLAGIPDDKLSEYANTYTVFGRVSPEQKKLLVDLMQKSGHKVAMVGDGVNDILALKQAECSVAMAGGSEAARNISHLVLLDNDFSSMPAVVREGRQIVNNMERASVLYLVKTLYTILLTVVLLVTSNIYPFEPVQMFVIETFIIGIPSFFIALEPNKKMFKGKFLVNVFRNVIPGALLVVLNLLAVYLFAGFWPTITTGEISTVGIIAATFAYLLVLVNVVTPLNRFRSIIVVFAAISSAFCFVVLGGRFFKLVPLSVPSLILLFLLMETTYIIMSVSKHELVKFWA